MLLHRRAPVLRALYCVACILVAGPVFAAERHAYEGGDWGLLDREAVIAAAAEITPEAFPDSLDATVDQKLMRAYREDGTAESQDETYLKVLTEAGRRNNTTLSLSFTLPYASVEVARLELIKPDGTVVPVDVAANANESIDDSQMGANIYDPNNRVLRINIPQLEIGDIVHSVTRTTTERPVMPGEYADESYFERGGYIRHISYVIRAPASRPLRHVLLRDELAGTITGSRSDEPGAFVYRWEINRVPRVFGEPSMPSHREVLQRVLVSTTPDWPSISRWYWEVVRPHLEGVTPEMTAAAKALTAGATGDLAKIKALFYFVSKNIRYMGVTPEKDRPGFEPHDVGITFEKRYGVCRDKAALLVALLRSAGFGAYPVLTNVGAKLDRDNPSVGFNHAIVAVELEKGNYVLMDPTDENTQQLLPAYENNQSYLVCRPEGEELRLSPIESPEQNLIRFQTSGTLEPTGGLKARSQVWFEGVNDNYVRAAFIGMKPDERWRDVEGILKRTLPGARMLSLQITPNDMRDTSASVHMQIEYAVDHAIVSGNARAVVMVPWIGSSWGVVNSLLGATGLEKRRFPMKTGIACAVQETISLTLAAGFGTALSLPSSPPIDRPTVSLGRRFEVNDQTLVCSRELKLKTVEFSPAEYLELKRILADAQYDARKAPIFAVADLTAKPVAPAETPAAPPILSDRRYVKTDENYTVRDPHSQDYRYHYVHEILTEQGKKSASEVKIHYNPAIEEVRIIHANVTSKAGQRQELGPDESHTMDADWNAAAKRYTGGKILVANLPGVEIGSMIDVEYEIKSHGKPFLSSFMGFQFRNVLEGKHVRFSVPAGVKTHTFERLGGIVTSETSTTNDARVWRWAAEHVEPVPAEDGTPPDWSYQPGVAVYVGESDDYFRELNAIFRDRAGRSEQAAGRARQLAGAATTKLDAVRAIRDFVATAIRVAGPRFTGLPLRELSDADRTLADGYGHDADRTILLHAMLTAIGLKPEFVLTSNLPAETGPAAFAKSFPFPGLFDQPLVTVAIDGVNYVVRIDQYARLGATWYDGKLALRLSDLAYHTVKATEECRTRQVLDAVFALSDNGTARITIEQKYHGNAYGSKNQFFAEITPEDRRRYFQDLVTGIAQGARPVGDLTTDFSGYPGIEKFTVEVDRFAVVDDRYFYFEDPVRYRLLAAETNRRVLPLHITDSMETDIHTQIILPAGYRRALIVPSGRTWAASDGSARGRRSTAIADGKFTITEKYEKFPAIVRPDVFVELQEIESTLEHASSSFFLLERDRSEKSEPPQT